MGKQSNKLRIISYYRRTLSFASTLLYWKSKQLIITIICEYLFISSVDLIRAKLYIYIGLSAILLGVMHA